MLYFHLLQEQSHLSRKVSMMCGGSQSSPKRRRPNGVNERHQQASYTATGYLCSLRFLDNVQ
jgi:hypothetical protein